MRILNINEPGFAKEPGKGCGWREKTQDMINRMRLVDSGPDNARVCELF